MIEQDTVKLLRECDAGIKMGVKSIDDVLGHVKNGELKQTLSSSKEEHEKLDCELRSMLSEYGDEGKKPALMAEAMSKIKTEVMIGIKEKDSTIADLMTDGCNMGVKSLSRYLNQYAAADERSKDLTKRLIKLEEDLSVSMRDFL